MAKKKAKVKACPLCGGTAFSRQREYGTIVGQEFEVERVQYKCESCKKFVGTVEELVESD